MGRQASKRYGLSAQLPPVLRVVAVFLFVLACLVIMLAGESEDAGENLIGAGGCLLIALCAVLGAELLEMIRDVANNSFDQLEILRSAMTQEIGTSRGATESTKEKTLPGEPQCSTASHPAEQAPTTVPAAAPSPKPIPQGECVKCPKCGSMLKIGAGQKITRGTRATCSKCGARVRFT